MSGGYFDYKQHEIQAIAESVKELIDMNDSGSLDAFDSNTLGYPQHVIDEFQAGLEMLRKAAIYTKRIDRLVSGDDGEESFLTNLHKDLAELEVG